MQLLTCTTTAPLPQRNPYQRPRRFGRREIFLDGASTVCSCPNVDPLGNCGGLSHTKALSRNDLSEMLCKVSLSSTRRGLLLANAAFALTAFPQLQAQALGDSSVSIEDVAPAIYPPGKLFPSEERIAKLFDVNTYSVVNIFDVTLRPQLNVTGVVEVPEGNGSGVVWDEKGHIVTNYHGLTVHSDITPVLKKRHNGLTVHSDITPVLKKRHT